MKLIIPMAGRGTRVRPHSHVTPKPLLNVRGQNMVERIVDTFARVLDRPIDDAVFVLGPDFGDAVRERLTKICGERGIAAHFAVQEEALGTAHAVFAAHEHLEGDGIVVFADTLFDMEPGVDLGKSDVTVWVKHVDDPSRFGVAVREGDAVTAFVEKPSEPISNEALIGIYYMSDLDQLKQGIQYLFDEKMTGHGDEYQLTDALDWMLNHGQRFTTASVDEWLDCGTIPALLETTGVILQKESGREGDYGTHTDSVIHEPVYIGKGATVTGSVVGPNVSIEAGATVSGSVLRDSVIFAHGEVTGSALVDSFVGQYAKVADVQGTLNVGDHSTVGVPTRG